MLHTAIQKLSKLQDNHQFFMDPTSPKDLSSRARLDLRCIFPSSLPPCKKKIALFNLACWGLTKIAPNTLSSCGLESVSQMDALVDISGYGFGDCWPVSRHQAMFKRAKNYWRRSKPVLLFSQMFSPFEEPYRRNIFLKTSEFCTKIYAREQASYDWLERIGVPEEKLGMAPDITIFCNPDIGNWQSPAKGEYACLVPNMRMLEQTDWGDRYIDMMVTAGKYLREKGLEVFIVLHESGKGDTELARTIKVKLDDKANVFHHEDAQVLKKFIGESELLIGSRYHSIVAALSQSVPALVMGWAHKYEELMADFGMFDFILDDNQNVEVITNKLSELLIPEKSEQVRTRLKNAKDNMQQENETMWEEVFKQLDKTYPL